MKEQPVDPSATPHWAEAGDLLTGDSDTFSPLTDKRRRELHLHCYRMIGSFHDAEDAVQQALIRAWRHLATFEGRSLFRAWLYRIRFGRPRISNTIDTDGKIGYPTQPTFLSPRRPAEEVIFQAH